MRYKEVRDLVKGIPHSTAEQGRQLYEFVRASRPRAVLELGFAHGVSSCYIGAALQANRQGLLTTIDLEKARRRQPAIGELLGRTRLEAWVRPIFTPSSYTWELMRLLEATEPGEHPFDFVFVDGAHRWETDGFAFFLADRLLAPGGWILFDDLHWTYASSPALRDTPAVTAMPPEERETPQVGKVFDLLVRRQPGYGEFAVTGSFGWARKSGSAGRPDPGS